MKPPSRLALELMSACLFLFDVSLSQSLPAADIAAPSLAVKREFRGAWIATVVNLDWPSSSGISVSAQKAELVSILDKLKDAGFNAVIFQVRTECDAMYNSPYEPWSYWLTGFQGRPPNPFFDPLQFAVDEAHKRGMEIHAWFNPYRCVRQADPTTSAFYQKAANHVSVVHPDWLLSFKYTDLNGNNPVTLKILNPGLLSVRDYVSMVVSDIVRRYDVDGIHADDYFYPYPDGTLAGIAAEDTLTFRQDPRGFFPTSGKAYPDTSYTNKLYPWRRDNVNLLIKQISDSVNTIKPNVKFGMSPFGIWKPGIPICTSCFNAYATLYCDAINWLQKKYVDYIAPQLYWAFGGGQDYGTLQPWWADSANANGRHFYTGNATYRIGSSYSVSEIPNQINFNRANPKVQGSIQFRALNVTSNLGGISDLLKSDVFSYGAIIPTMPWKPDLTPPNAPSALQVSTLGQNAYGLQWTAPPPASDLDTAARYAVYRFSTQTPQQTDRDKARNLILLSGGTSAAPPYAVDTVGVQYYYAVSSLDRNNNESILSNVASVPGGIAAIPAQPSALAPVNNDQFFSKTGSLKWSRSPQTLAYKLEFDSAQTLGSSSMVLKGTLTDTVYFTSGLAPQKKYYWRVAAGNQAGVSGYSPTFSFKTGWPLAPTLVSPLAVFGASRNPTFVWNKSQGTTFELQVTNVPTKAVVLDTTITDSTLTMSKTLDASVIYSWRVMASNSAGASDWSVEGRFQTGTTSVVFEPGMPTEYSLSQNYPNPFNPTTTINFSVPERVRVDLRVYDMLGREVATLIDGKETNPGYYRMQWNGDNQYGEKVAAGVYFYRVSAGGFSQSRKMVLLK